MDFVKPYESGINDSYVVSDTETVYTMTKDAFAGKGGMKFMGLRFMSIWVFPMAILGTVIEFLFVGPIKGSNPFGWDLKYKKNYLYLIIEIVFFYIFKRF